MDEDVKRIAKFSAKRGEDYSLWSMRMEALLESRGLLEVVLQDTSDGQTDLQSSDEYKLKTAKARSLIVQG